MTAGVRTVARKRTRAPLSAETEHDARFSRIVSIDPAGHLMFSTNIRLVPGTLLVCAIGWITQIPLLSADEPLRIEDRWPWILDLLAAPSMANSEKAIKLLDYLRRDCPEVSSRLHTGDMTAADAENYLLELQRRSSTIRSLAHRFAAIRPGIVDRFVRMFPDFKPSQATVYSTVSRFRFDGKVPHDRLNSLLLALDGMAKFHGKNAPIAVIFSHELFHLYHFQLNPPPADPDQVPLYRLIWQEGLACYASSLLNPDSPMQDILFDPRLAIEGPKFVRSSARQLLSDLQSTDDIQTAEYMTYRTSGAAPPRMGYLIGYRIAAKLAKQHSLSELARLRDPGLRFMMRREVGLLTTES